MSIDSPADTTTARRRIVQLPVRTEAPLALIAAENTSTTELEERLKRAHPVITFPSFSHFLAERPRSQPWVGIVVARSGAWDPRLDGYVRSRRSIALFGLTEESYGFPETVARAHSIEELEPWLTALTAPLPPPLPKKERVKRATRSQEKAALTGLVPIWMVKSARASEAPTEAPAVSKAERRTPEAARREPTIIPTASASDRELAELSARPDARAEIKATARHPKLPPRAAAVPLHLAPTKLAPRSAEDDRKFLRVAAELGLSRAFELLEELRERAMQLSL